MSHSFVPNSDLGRATLLLVLLIVVILLGAAEPSSGQTTKSVRPRRARVPPSANFPDDIFFKDAFREALIGPRPALLGRSQPTVVASSKPEQASPLGGSTYRWSAIVSAETLEDEVKALQMSVDALVTTPARFSSGGFSDVRREFSELAMLFAVIGEYDGGVLRPFAHRKEASLTTLWDFEAIDSIRLQIPPPPVPEWPGGCPR